MEITEIGVGEHAILEGAHQCVVRYVGELPVGTGIW